MKTRKLQSLHKPTLLRYSKQFLLKMKKQKIGHQKINQKTKYENIKSAANAENLPIYHVYLLKETAFCCALRALTSKCAYLYPCTLRDHKHACWPTLCVLLSDFHDYMHGYLSTQGIVSNIWHFFTTALFCNIFQISTIVKM